MLSKFQFQAFSLKPVWNPFLQGTWSLPDLLARLLWNYSFFFFWWMDRNCCPTKDQGLILQVRSLVFLGGFDIAGVAVHCMKHNKYKGSNKSHAIDEPHWGGKKPRMACLRLHPRLRTGRPPTLSTFLLVIGCFGVLCVAAFSSSSMLCTLPRRCALRKEWLFWKKIQQTPNK